MIGIVSCSSIQKIIINTLLAELKFLNYSLVGLVHLSSRTKLYTIYIRVNGVTGRNRASTTVHVI